MYNVDANLLARYEVDALDVCVSQCEGFTGCRAVDFYRDNNVDTTGENCYLLSDISLGGESTVGVDAAILSATTSSTTTSDLTTSSAMVSSQQR